MNAETRTKTYGIVATHCCVCRLPLVDAKSVTLSIGPVCGARYGKATTATTPDMLKLALGLLAFSGLDPEVVAEVLRHKHDAQAVNNTLLKHASMNYDRKSIVLKVTPIMRALGYAMLADKLETDRTRLSIRKIATLLGDEVLEIKTPYHPVCARELSRIPGAKRTQKAGPRSAATEVPLSRWDHALCVLGLYYGNEGIATDSGVTPVPPRRWSDLLAFAPPPAPMQAPMVTSPVLPLDNVRLEDSGAIVRVFTPFKVEFLTDIRLVKGRRWNGASKCWEIPAQEKAHVAGLLKTHYGVTVSV